MKKVLIPVIFLISLFASCSRPIDITDQNNNIPPSVPVNVHIVSAFDAEIDIEWQGNSESDLKGYNVYRRTDSTQYKIIKFTTDNYAVDDSLNYNTTYYYEITAVDVSNLESSPSTEVSAKPVNKYKPYPIQNITINARDWEDTISVFLTWVPSGESDIDGYNVYRDLNPSFTADSTNFIGFTGGSSYSDTSNLKLYTEYYYRIRAVDKGGLLGDEGPAANDEILGIPEIIFPQNNSAVPYFQNFIIKAIKVPAQYKIIVQSNEFFGEIWSSTFSTSVIDDSLNIKFTPDYVYSDKYYYWRVVTFSGNNPEPNSISRLYKFIIKQ